jgi:hypothetical protein
MLLEDGSLLGKYWFSVSDEEQDRCVPGADICGVASSRLPVVLAASRGLVRGYADSDLPPARLRGREAGGR